MFKDQLTNKDMIMYKVPVLKFKASLVLVGFDMHQSPRSCLIFIWIKTAFIATEFIFTILHEA